jgi:CRISPR system Cascade subunit CasC
MIVELHMLQNFAPSCLNRDDTNSPKECQFGGCRRARISSQCIKRAIRSNGIFRDMLEGYLAARSVRFPNQVYERLVRLGVQQSFAKEIGKGLEAIAKKAEAKEGAEKVGEENEMKQSSKPEDTYELDIFKTPQMVFYTEDEVNECARQIKALLDKGMKPKEVLKKDKKGKFVNLPVFPVPRSADIALFGRMVTSAHFDNVDAACQVAHTISTHKVGVEFDFYTAVDDLQPKEETGAGMMGDVEFNSACYYRYSNIDLRLLEDNLLGKPRDKASPEELKEAKTLAQKTVEVFIRAAASAVPSGKQTSFAAQNPPDFIMAVVRRSGSWSLVNAFARPVKEDGDLMIDSITALVNYWGKLNQAYGTDGIKAKLAMSLSDVDLDGLEQVASFEKFVQRVNQAVATGS